MTLTSSSDRSQQVNWTVRQGTDVTLTCTFTSSGAYDLSSYTIAATVSDLKGNTVLSPTVSNGGANGILTLTLTNTQTNLTGNQYFWNLSITDPVDFCLINGIFEVNDFVWDSENTNNTGTITVDISGTTVTISIVST